MAGDSIKCPHCECKVKLSDIEKEDGRCPECGDVIVASSYQKDYDNDLDEDYDNDLDREYESDDWNLDDDDTEEPDILDELNEDPVFFDEDGAPRKRRRASGMGFQAPQASSSPSKRGKKKK